MTGFRTNRLCRGRAVARLLTGVWRPDPPELPNDLEKDVDAISLVQASGTGGLIGRSTPHSPHRKNLLLRPCIERYRANLVQTVFWQEHLRKMVSALRKAGIDPLLIKGWSSARHYGQGGLRSFGDIDLCVAPNQIRTAITVLAETSQNAHSVDLHEGIPDLKDRTWEQAQQRSLRVRCGATEVRILGAEDHLRLLCLHFVRHMGMRPVWLCDVAAALEAESADFDWDYCLSGQRRWADWVLCVVGLAQTLLGARINDPDIAKRASRLPAWAVPYLLRTWGTFPNISASIIDNLRKPERRRPFVEHYLLNPMRTAYRLRLRPNTSNAILQAASWLRVPLMISGRLTRELIRKSRPALPFDVHPVRAR